MNPTDQHESPAPPSTGRGPRFKLAALTLVLVSGLCCLGRLAHSREGEANVYGFLCGSYCRERGNDKGDARKGLFD